MHSDVRTAPRIDRVFPHLRRLGGARRCAGGTRHTRPRAAEARLVQRGRSAEEQRRGEASAARELAGRARGRARAPRRRRCAANRRGSPAGARLRAVGKRGQRRARRTGVGEAAGQSREARCQTPRRLPMLRLRTSNSRRLSRCPRSLALSLGKWGLRSRSRARLHARSIGKAAPQRAPRRSSPTLALPNHAISWSFGSESCAYLLALTHHMLASQCACAPHLSLAYAARPPRTAPKSGNILQGFCPTGKGLQACEWSPQHVENVTKKTAKFSVLFN